MARRPKTAPDGGGAGVRHASAVAWGARGLLIEGPSGSGKSSLALLLLGFGAALIADDGVALALRDGLPFATAPAAIAGLIEARGTGVLGAATVPGAWIVAVADVGATPAARLPEAQESPLCGHPVPRLSGPADPIFAAACMAFLRHGRRAP